MALTKSKRYEGVFYNDLKSGDRTFYILYRDILSNKKTFLLLTALNTAQGSTKDSLLKWINTSDQPKEKVIAVTEIYNSLNVRGVAEKKMNELYDVALSHLDSIPVDDASKQPLKDLAASLMIRQN